MLEALVGFTGTPTRVQEAPMSTAFRWWSRSIVAALAVLVVTVAVPAAGPGAADAQTHVSAPLTRV
jgi:hypothetical protein